MLKGLALGSPSPFSYSIAVRFALPGYTSLKFPGVGPCRNPASCMMRRGCPLDDRQRVADLSKFSSQRSGVLIGNRPGRLNDAEVVGPAVLADVFVGFTKLAIDVGRNSGKQGDDVATVPPASKDDVSCFEVGQGDDVFPFGSRTAPSRLKKSQRQTGCAPTSLSDLW